MAVLLISASGPEGALREVRYGPYRNNKAASSTYTVVLTGLIPLSGLKGGGGVGGTGSGLPR